MECKRQTRPIAEFEGCLKPSLSEAETNGLALAGPYSVFAGLRPEQSFENKATPCAAWVHGSAEGVCKNILCN
jgi:hypothetical protein